MIRNALQRFMYGRYGNDTLNNFLIILFLVFYFLYAVTHASLFKLLSTVVVVVEVAQDVKKIRERVRIILRKIFKIFNIILLPRIVLFTL